MIQTSTRSDRITITRADGDESHNYVISHTGGETIARCEWLNLNGCPFGAAGSMELSKGHANPPIRVKPTDNGAGVYIYTFGASTADN